MSRNAFGMPMPMKVVTGHEPSAWMRARIGLILRYVDALDQGALADTVVMVPLHRHGFTDPREDYTCDRCRRYEPEGLNCAVQRPRPNVVITGGLCDACADSEGWPHE